MIYLSKIFSGVACLPLLFLAIGAVTAVPQTTQQPADGPSLEVTLKFIGDFMTTESPVSYTKTDVDFKDMPDSYSYSYREFRQEGCVLHYVINEKLQHPANVESLKYARRADFSKLNPLAIRVQTVAEFEAEVVASVPQLRGTTYTITPETYKVRSTRSLDDDNEFFLADRQRADRLAKAINHAIVLCGGAKDQPF